jgi:hypothetical protein
MVFDKIPAVSSAVPWTPNVEQFRVHVPALIGTWHCGPAALNAKHRSGEPSQLKLSVAPPALILEVSCRQSACAVPRFLLGAAGHTTSSRGSCIRGSFADGASHALLFSYDGPTTEITSFTVDNVELLSCPLPELIFKDGFQ